MKNQEIIWTPTKIRLGALKIWKENPRYIAEDAFEKLSEQIATKGFTTPLLVNTDMMLIAGHQRRKSLYKNGAKDDDEIWCMVPDRKLNKKEFEELAIGDNLFRGQFDLDKLQDNWSTKQLTGFGFKKIDLKPQEMDDTSKTIKTRAPKQSTMFVCPVPPELKERLNVVIDTLKQKQNFELNHEALEFMTSLAEKELGIK